MRIAVMNLKCVCFLLVMGILTPSCICTKSGNPTLTRHEYQQPQQRVVTDFFEEGIHGLSWVIPYYTPHIAVSK